MIILYIWDADYPWDIRVEKICYSLAKNEHEVHIAARNLKKSSTYELINGVHVHRMKPINNDFMNYAISFPVFFSPIWKNLINNIIEEKRINLIIVRDLPMAVAGIWAGKKYNIPVVFDMAEDYCSMLRVIMKDRKYHGFNIIVRNPYFANIVEKYVMNKFCHVIVVVEEAKDIVINAGANKDKITVIGNTPTLDASNNMEYNRNKDVYFVKNNYSAIYTGGITPDRGLALVIDAIPNIIKEIPNFLFVVIGKGYSTEYLKALVIKKNLQKYVKWIGWVDHENIYDYIYASKIGLIPHLVTDHTNTTIPNKIFDYMACGIPVIASDAVPMKRIINEEKCGKIFQSGNTKELADAIISVYKEKYDYGTNGKNAIINRYNWGKEENKLMNIIDTVSRLSQR